MGEISKNIGWWMGHSFKQCAHGAIPRACIELWLSELTVFTPQSVRPKGVLSSPSCAAVPGAARTLLATTPTWYVQQIKFIQTFNPPPPQALFLPKVKGLGRRFKKILVNVITCKINIGSLQFFTSSYP